MIEEVKVVFEDRCGIVEIFWCGEEECGFRMEEEFDVKMFGILYFEEKVKVLEGKKCLVCGREVKFIVRFVRIY